MNKSAPVAVGDIVINRLLLGGVDVWYQDAEGKYQHTPMEITQIIDTQWGDTEVVLQHMVHKYETRTNIKNVQRVTPHEIINYRISQLKK